MQVEPTTRQIVETVFKVAKDGSVFDFCTDSLDKTTNPTIDEFEQVIEDLYLEGVIFVKRSPKYWNNGFRVVVGVDWRDL